MSASQDLARRAVACKGWRRMSGMLGADGWRVFDVGIRDDGAAWADLVEVSSGDQRFHIGEWLPDLDDHATLGCLLALVREAWGDERIEHVCYGDWCELDVSSRGRAYNQAALFEIGGESLAAVLVAALEAAP